MSFNKLLERAENKVFHRRLTNGGFLIIGYCLRTIGYCFPYCLLELFVGGQGLDRGDLSKSFHWGKPWKKPVTPLLFLPMTLVRYEFKGKIGYRIQYGKT